MLPSPIWIRAVVSVAVLLSFAMSTLQILDYVTYDFDAPIPASFHVFTVGLLCVGPIWAVTGALLVLFRPRNMLGWLVLFVGVTQAAWFLVPSLPFPQLLAMVSFAIVLPAVYPDGRLPSKWWWWPVGLAVLGYGLLVLEELGGPVLVADRFGFAGIVVAGVIIYSASVVRLARARPPQRQQLAWLVCVVIPPMVACFAVPRIWSWAGWELNWFFNTPFLLLVSMVLVPVAIMVGVFRYGLLGIETVLRRWLVYGTLTVLVFTVYLAVTLLAGAALQTGPVPGVVAAAIVAVGLAPARDWLQGAADRIVYGERRDPLRAISRLGRRVADTGEAALLPAALTAITEAVRAPTATVSTVDGRLVGAVGAGEDGRSVTWCCRSISGVSSSVCCEWPHQEMKPTATGKGGCWPRWRRS